MREHIVVALRQNERIVVAGASAMWVAFGSVDVFGTTVRAARAPGDEPGASAVEVHSLDWAGLLSIAPSRDRGICKASTTGTSTARGTQSNSRERNCAATASTKGIYNDS